MKIKLNNGHPASQADIAALQDRIGEPLMPDFADFVARYDGARPESNCLKVGDGNGCAVNGFIPVREIPAEMAYIENLPDRSYPIACDSFGNYIFLNQSVGGAVFFWDHEMPEHELRLADSFRQFLDLLEPFDLGSVELKLEQAIRVWVDPSFLAVLDKYRK